MKELHIKLSLEMYNDIKTLFPERGQVSILIRSLLSQYIKRLKETKTSISDPITPEAVSKVVDNSSKFGRPNG